MSKATLELGGGNWAAKDAKLLGYAVGDTSGKYVAREFTFSRAADIAATRVNKDGLVEKFRENQFTYSNDFRISSGWGHAGLSAYYGPENNPQYVPDGEQGYDGSGGASFIVSTTNTSPSTSVHRISASIPSITAVQTFSIYAKALGYKWLAITTNNGSMEAYFDLENGELGTVESNVIEAKMVDAGNGWYRCSMTVSNAIVVTSVGFGISDGDENHVFAGSKDEGGTNRGGIYIQDAQWERGLVATEYIHSESTTGKAGVSEDLPRIDYTNDKAQFVIEPQRINIINLSEYFEGAGWTANGAGVGSDAIITTNYAISPEGLKNATRVQLNLNGGTASGDRSRIKFDAGSTGGSQTNSIYVKSNSGPVNVHIRTIDRIESYTVGETWQRITSSHSNGTGYFEFGLHASYNSDTADVCVWGAQVEEGLFATSYIPTHGASGTRSRDVPSFDFDAATAAWTVFMDVEEFTVESGGNTGHFFFRGAADNTISCLFFNQTCFGYRGSSGYLYVCGASALGIDGTVFNGKWAVTYDGSSTMKFYVDGSLVTTITDADPSYCRGIQSGQLAYDNALSRPRKIINDLKIYNKELSQTEAEALTA